MPYDTLRYIYIYYAAAFSATPYAAGRYAFAEIFLRHYALRTYADAAITIFIRFDADIADAALRYAIRVTITRCHCRAYAAIADTPCCCRR